MDFFANNSTPVFVLDPNKESNSGNESFSALDKKASVAKSYLAVTYECEIDSNKLQVNAGDMQFRQREEQLNAVIESNPNIFTKKDIGGNSVYIVLDQNMTGLTVMQYIFRRVMDHFLSILFAFEHRPGR